MKLELDIAILKKFLESLDSLLTRMSILCPVDNVNKS